MNQIVPHRVGASAPTAKPTKAEQIASGLRRVNETLIAPRQRIREAVVGFSNRAWPIVRDGIPGRRMLLGEDRWAEDDRRQVRKDLVTIPRLEALHSLRAQAEALFGQAPDRAQNRLLIALMVDAFPNARPHSPETFFEVLAHEITESGFTPAAVACALREIVRTSKFLPSIAEVVEACEKEADTQRSNTVEIARAIKARELLEEAGQLIAAFDSGERYTPEPIKPIKWPPGENATAPSGHRIEGSTQSPEIAR